MDHAVSYDRLLNEDTESDATQKIIVSYRYRIALWQYVVIGVLFCSLLVNVALLSPSTRARGVADKFWLYCMYLGCFESAFADPHTAPAAVAIEEKIVKFDSGLLGGLTSYQGEPTDTNNKLWEDLYARDRLNIPGILF
jgi:hypothetical protein